MIKVGRVHPLSLEAKRQLLIDAARNNMEEEVDELESLTSKGVAFDDAVAQTLTRWEILTKTGPKREKNWRRLSARA